MRLFQMASLVLLAAAFIVLFIAASTKAKIALRVVNGSNKAFITNLSTLILQARNRHNIDSIFWPPIRHRPICGDNRHKRRFPHFVRIDSPF